MEIVIEAIIEIFGELIITGIVAVFAALYRVYESESRLKKAIKNIGAFLLFGLVLGLLIYALFTKTGLYITIILGYLIIISLIKIASFAAHNFSSTKPYKYLAVISSLTNYGFGSVIIYFAGLGGVTKGEIMIIILAALGLFVFIILDVFRLVRQRKRRA